MLKSNILFNTTVATAYGNAEFDHEGISKNLTEDAQRALDAVPYLTYIADEKEEPKEEPKEVVKEEKPKAKKAPAKKAPAKKKVTKE